jgi:hypothetical protein
VRLYAVTFDCPHCAQTHDVIGGAGLGLVIDHGPDQAGTVAQLWPRGSYPPAVAQVLQDLVYCDALGDIVPMGEPQPPLLPVPHGHPIQPVGRHPMKLNLPPERSP